MTRAAIVVVVLCAALATSCGTTPHPTSGSSSPARPSANIDVDNVDGPPVELIVNGITVSDLHCGGVVQLATIMTLPPLPWTIQLRRQDGSVLGSWTEDGSNGDRAIVLRGTQPFELAMGESIGPPPQSPCAT